MCGYTRVAHDRVMPHMDVFISWSGAKSKAVAEALRSVIPGLMNAAKPFLSSHDISSGAWWPGALTDNLSRARFAIICVTKANLHEDWILFEAGALAKWAEHSCVCPLLIDLRTSDVKWPLAQFQMCMADKEGIQKMMSGLNQHLGSSGNPEFPSVFEALYPKLSSALENLPEDEPIRDPVHRDQSEILEELVQLVRQQSNFLEHRLPGPRAIGPRQPKLAPLTLRLDAAAAVVERVAADQGFDSKEFEVKPLEGTEMMMTVLTGTGAEAETFDRMTSVSQLAKDVREFFEEVRGRK